MDRTERKIQRFRIGTGQMKAAQRKALQRAMTATLYLGTKRERERMFDIVTAIGEAAGRDVMKANSDKWTDSKRRKLVGARVPQEAAARCRRCAQARGISLYRFVVEALEEACKRVENVPPGVTESPAAGGQSDEAAP